VGSPECAGLSPPVPACERSLEAWAVQGSNPDLREVLEVAGRPDDAAEAFEQSLVRFDEKDSLAGAARVRQRLGVLRAAQIS